MIDIMRIYPKLIQRIPKITSMFRMSLWLGIYVTDITWYDKGLIVFDTLSADYRVAFKTITPALAQPEFSLIATNNSHPFLFSYTQNSPA
jgi:hypothetical protein